MLSNLKTHILWGAVVIVLGAVAYHTECLYQKQKKRATSFESTISNLNKEIIQTKIRMNDSLELYQATVDHLTYSKKNIEAQYGELLKASKIRPKDINAMTNVSTQSHSVDTIIAYVDTFGGLRAQLNDKWANIDVEVKPDRKTIIDYTFRDSISVIAVQKRHSLLFGLIKWRSLEKTSVISHNPKAQITGLQTIDIIE